MAGTITVRTSDIYVFLGAAPAFRITDWPEAGTMFSIEKIVPIATFQGGQNNSASFMINNSATYRVAFTVQYGSESDAFFGRAKRAFVSLGALLPVSISMGAPAGFGGLSYVTGQGGFETEPTREVAGDSLPAVTWTITGNFPEAKAGVLVEAATLTTAQINQF